MPAASPIALEARNCGLQLPTAQPAAASLPHSAAAADAERQELLERVEACSGPSTVEVYKLQAVNRKRSEEVRELQKVGPGQATAQRARWMATTLLSGN